MKVFILNKSVLIIFYSAVLCFLSLSINSANAADNLKLHWKAPAQFTNGGQLNPKTDLKEYRLYYGPSEAFIKENVVFLEPTKKSVSLSLLQLSKLKSSLIYFAMSSVATDGSESDLSPSIFYLP